MNEVRLIVSDDGSHTLFVPALNEHYHSTHGAIQESRHVFIEAGLKKAISLFSNLNLLEVGFGTGLNALLTYLESSRLHFRLNYLAVEPFPLEEPVYSRLNYGQLLEFPDAAEAFNRVHAAGWNFPNFLGEHFILNKISSSLQDLHLSSARFHLIYFDAFSPEVQPEMWDEAVFSKLFDCLLPGGILVTYCCKGTVKRAMKSAGFSLEKLPGPPGKREILRAVKPL